MATDIIHFSPDQECIHLPYHVYQVARRWNEATGGRMKEWFSVQAQIFIANIGRIC
jgi:hypothetical protein